MDSTVRLSLLGTVHVTRDGAPVSNFRSRKAIALLGYLAVHGQPISRERLAGLFWPDQQNDRGLANLSWVLNRVSSLLPGCLEADRHTVHFLSPGNYWLDVESFRELAARGDAGAWAAAADLYRGDLLEGLYLDGCAEFELWLVSERERWRRQAADLFASLIAHHRKHGDYAGALSFARRLLMVQPWCEETHRHVMDLLARTGQRSAALAQYEACCRVLAEELGVEPGAETRSLHERIKAIASERLDLHRPPCPPTPLVGRDEELAEIGALLADPAHRLLTLVGPGGIGKTHLALQAAVDVADAGLFLEGVAFAPLSAVALPDRLIPALAGALQLSFHGSTDPTIQLLNYLHKKEMLLVLDNFEHLLAGSDGQQSAGARLLAQILARAPRVKLLVTSRQRLNLQAECLLPVRGLPFPADEMVEGVIEYGAVALFVQSARRVHRQFAASGAEMRAVLSICRLVQGMPLGLVLAAAWIDALTPAAIAAEIERSLDFLQADLRDLPARQRSMAAVFDHSWRLLSAEERGVFARLSVFRGGFTREAAQSVAGASLPVLRALAAKSFLQRDAGGRYDVHALLRMYATGRLAQAPGDEEATRNQHCAYYARFLHDSQSRLMGREQTEALAEIAAEIDNVLAAWDWAVAQHKIEEMDRSLASLTEFLWIRALYEPGEKILAQAADELGRARADISGRQATMVLGKVLAQQGRFCRALGLLSRGDTLLERSLAIFYELGARREMAYTLLYFTSRGVGWSGKMPLCIESLAIFRQVGDRKGTALCLAQLGSFAIDPGEYHTAQVLYRESFAIFSELGDRQGMAETLRALGYIAWVFGEYHVAKQRHREVLVLNEELGDQRAIAMCLNAWGIAEAGLGEYESAIQLLQRSLSIQSSIGCRLEAAVVLSNLSEIAIVRNEYEKAIQHAEESVSIYDDLIDQCSTWYWRVMGEAACGLGELSDAGRYLCQALEMAVADRELYDVMLTLVGIASWLAAKGKESLALELLALVDGHPATWQWARDKATRLVTCLESELHPDVIARARDHGRARDLDATVIELQALLTS